MMRNRHHPKIESGDGGGANNALHSDGAPAKSSSISFKSKYKTRTRTTLMTGGSQTQLLGPSTKTRGMIVLIMIIMTALVLTAVWANSSRNLMLFFFGTSSGNMSNAPSLGESHLNIKRVQRSQMEDKGRQADAESGLPFSCQLSDDERRLDADGSSRARRLRTHKIVVIFSEKRCGTNLLQHLFQRINQATNFHADIISLYELFLPVETAIRVERLLQVFAKHCQLPEAMTEGNTISDHDSEKSSQSQEWLKRYSKWAQQHDNNMDDFDLETPWSKRLEETARDRFANPREFFQFIKNIPTESEYGFHVFNIKLHQIGKFNENEEWDLSVADFVDLILDVWDRSDVVFLVQWRSRLIESYTSLQIADANKYYEGRNTTETDAITVDQSLLQTYVERWFDFFFDQVRKTLQDRELTYGVVEYNRDLLDARRQVQAMKRIMKLMGIPDDYTVEGHDALEQAFDMSRKHRKQALVPVDKLVLNWADVQSWGFGDLDPDFEDDFDVKQNVLFPA